MAVYIKSLAWLFGAGGFSYSLYKIITPDDSNLRKYLPEGQVHHRPELNNQPRFMESLRKIALEKKSIIEENNTGSDSSKSPNTPSSVGK